MPEHELKFLLDNKSVVYIPIYSMFDHQTCLVDLECDGNVNRWMTNLYKSGQTWKKMVVFGPCRDLAKNEVNFETFKSKLDRNFTNLEYVESNAFGGGAKKQRSSSFPKELIPQFLDKILRCDVAIVESQEMFGALLTAKNARKWNGELVYWCPVCATSKKTRTFLESSREADITCFRNADHVIVATDEQASYVRECGVADSKITVAREFIDRTLPMFDYEIDLNSLGIVSKLIKEDKTCLYLPFRLSDEGYKIWEILDSIYIKLMSGKIEVLAPNVNGSSFYELVSLCRSNGSNLNDGAIRAALERFHPVSPDRKTYYTLIDNCEDLVIPYFEDWKFIMHAAVDELILGSKKPKCLVIQSKSELDRFLADQDRIKNSLRTIASKKSKMDEVFNAISSSISFKRLVSKYGAMNRLPSFIFSGVGKNWYICEKVVKTFISMGIQAQALDCMHALHGDLGMLKAEGPKVLVFVSRSGTTAELVKMAKVVKKLKNENILSDLETVALFLNKAVPNRDLYDSWILPDDIHALDTICEFDERDLVPSLSINILQMILDMLGVLIYEGKDDLVDGYVYNHLSGGNGEKLGGAAILKDIK